MAPPSQDSKDPLDVLDLMMNEALVQTAKALRATRKDASGNLVQTHGSVQFKLPNTLRTFHNALSDLESEILRAKAVVQRDMARVQAVQASKPQPEVPHPVEPQTKSPMVIDIDSSPVAMRDSTLKVEPESESKPMAPFPDMGIDLSGSLQPDAATGMPSQQLKDEQLQAPAEMKMEPDGFSAPTATMDSTGLDLSMNPEGAQDAPNADFTFTNMEFTLVPAQEEVPGNQNGFDLAAYASQPNDASLSLDGLLPQADASQPNVDTSFAPANPGDMQMDSGLKNDSAADLDFANIDLVNTDFGNTDGDDFDFGLDGGNSFDELMNSHDDFDTTMEHGNFDNEFFGLNDSQNA